MKEKTAQVFHLNDDYKNFLVEIKNKVRSSRLQAALAANREMIQLYWYIGKRTIEKETETCWGDKWIETLSKDLQIIFPETRGFSTRNIKYMRRFAVNYPKVIAKQSVSQLPWGHIILLIQRVKDIAERDWYAIA